MKNTKNYFLLLFLFLTLFQSNDLKSFQYDKYFNRKNLAIGAGFLLALPVLYYLYNMTKKDKNSKQPENNPPTFIPLGSRVVTGIDLNKIAPSSQREKKNAKIGSDTAKTSQVGVKTNKELVENPQINSNQNIINSQTIASNAEIKDYGARRENETDIKKFINSEDTKIFIEENGENSRKRIDNYVLKTYLKHNERLCQILFKENKMDGFVIYAYLQLRVEPYTKSIHIDFLAATSDDSAKRLLNHVVANNKEIDHINVNDWKVNDDSIAWLTENGFEKPSDSSNFQYLEKKIQQ